MLTVADQSQSRFKIRKVEDRTVVTVTPELARAWLQISDDYWSEHEDLKQRLRINQRSIVTIKRLKAEMSLGQFRDDVTAVCFLKDEKTQRDVCMDGQHRLAAVAQLDFPVDLWCRFSVDPEVMKKIDTNMTRTCADKLAMEGYSNNNILSAALSHLVREAQGHIYTQSRQAVTDEQRMEMMRLHKPMEKWVSRASNLMTGKCGAIGYITYVVAEIFHDPTEARSIIEVMKTGQGAYTNDPIHKWLMADLNKRWKGDAPGAFAALKWAVNKRLKGDSTKQLHGPKEFFHLEDSQGDILEFAHLHKGSPYFTDPR